VRYLPPVMPCGPFRGTGFQRRPPKPLEPPLESVRSPPLNPPFPPPGEVRKEPDAPRLPMSAELLEIPPLAGSRDIPPARVAGSRTAEERPGPL